MVSLETVIKSNSLVSTLPSGLVAVFVGGTSGIGAITLKKFVQRAVCPRVYIVGRSAEAADNGLAVCRTINPGGHYVFVKADVCLIRNVDEVCDRIKEKEKSVNLLFMSAGLPGLDRTDTEEGLNLLAAMHFYSRMRFIMNLLPLIQAAPGLRRVVTVVGGGLEGTLDCNDLGGKSVPLIKIRGHLPALITLGLDAIAEKAPDVSFVHTFPGTVDTEFQQRIQGYLGVILRAVIWLFGRWICVPLDQSGERHLFVATSSRYPPAVVGGIGGVSVAGNSEIAIGSCGALGGGVYTVGWDCESAADNVVSLLRRYRGIKTVAKIRSHVENEFRRIAEDQL